MAYHDFTDENIEISIYALREKWRESIRELLSYPFEQLGVNRVTIKTMSDNMKAIRLAIELGFQPEGRLREMAPGRDQLIFGLLKKECRYI